MRFLSLKTLPGHCEGASKIQQQEEEQPSYSNCIYFPLSLDSMLWILQGSLSFAMNQPVSTAFIASWAPDLSLDQNG